jgi:hypothetical protein
VGSASWGVCVALGGFCGEVGSVPQAKIIKVVNNK